MLLAFPAVHVLMAMAPKELPRADEIHLNGWVLAFTLGLSVLTALVSSLVPALRAASVDPAEALKYDASRGMIAMARRDSAMDSWLPKLPRPLCLPWVPGFFCTP